MAELKVGGEVDAFCTKCKMLLAHTVLAIWAGQIKRVRCNTCMGEHAFRKSEPGSGGVSSSSRARAPIAAKAKAKPSDAGVSSSYGELIAGKDVSAALRYDVKAKYVVGELVRHPAFGVGVVAAARGFDKIDVAFPGSVKTLVHNKGAGPVTLAKPPPPKRPDVESIDETHQPGAAAETSDDPDAGPSSGD